MPAQRFTCAETFENISELYFKDGFTVRGPKSLARDSGFVVYGFNESGGTFGHLPLYHKSETQINRSPRCSFHSARSHCVNNPNSLLFPHQLHYTSLREIGKEKSPASCRRKQTTFACGDQRAQTSPPGSRSQTTACQASLGSRNQLAWFQDSERKKSEGFVQVSCLPKENDKIRFHFFLLTTCPYRERNP